MFPDQGMGSRPPVSGVGDPLVGWKVAPQVMEKSLISGATAYTRSQFLSLPKALSLQTPHPAALDSVWLGKAALFHCLPNCRRLLAP